MKQEVCIKQKERCKQTKATKEAGKREKRGGGTKKKDKIKLTPEDDFSRHLSPCDILQLFILHILV